MKKSLNSLSNALGTRLLGGDSGSSVLLTDLMFDRDQPRHDTNDAQFQELVESIRKVGVISPITITRDRKILAGERRVRASIEAGKTHIDVHYVDDLDAFERLERQMIENLIREDMSKFDQAQGVMNLIQHRLGVSASQAQKMLRQAVERPDDEAFEPIKEAVRLLNVSLSTFEGHYLPLLKLDARLLELIEQRRLKPSTAVVAQRLEAALLDGVIKRLRAGETITRLELEAMLKKPTLPKNLRELQRRVQQFGSQHKLSLQADGRVRLTLNLANIKGAEELIKKFETTNIFE